MSDRGFMTLEELIAQQPPEARARIEVEYRRMCQQVEDFRAIRRVIARSSADLARRLDAAEGSFCKLERRTERAIRTLRRFAAKMGGGIEIAVHLPDQPPLRLDAPAAERVPRPEEPVAGSPA